MGKASTETANSSNLTVILLTLNEEQNLPHALDSVRGWAQDVFILDSFSTDRTVEIARSFGCQVFQNRFENYSKQRNYALDALPITTEWVFFLDADERLPMDLKTEITERLSRNPEENGFYIKRRFFWMGRWVRRGYYPVWILRLFRAGKARCEDRPINEHMIVEGKTGRLIHDFCHEDHRDLTHWIEKHNDYATREAVELIRARDGSAPVAISGQGSQASRKRWIRERIWNHLPPLLRPFLYFAYRYVIRGGFLDGRAGFTYHFLQGLWFPMLVDIKYLELTRNRLDRKHVQESGTR
jgi:glycosyltransferase involved in cell wall biosynthesis